LALPKAARPAITTSAQDRIIGFLLTMRTEGTEERDDVMLECIKSFDQMREVPFVRKADDLTLATSHLAQSSSASRVTAAQAGFFILSRSGERPER
jgi:hypothetical protein